MIRMRMFGATALAALLLAAGMAQAQKTDPQTRSGAQSDDPVDQLLNRPVPSMPKPPRVNDGETYSRADDSEQTAEELRTTRALNDEMSAQNQLAENQERADQEAFELERARYQATVDASTRERLAYEESLRQADTAHRQWQNDQAEAERARMQWEADVRACQSGDRSRCAPPNSNSFR